MTPEQLAKMKLQIKKRIAWLEDVMRNARQENQIYNYLYYDGEIIALHSFLHMLDGIELEKQESQ